MSEEQLIRQRAVRTSVDVFISLSVIVLIGYMAISIIAPFFGVVLWAVILAIGAYPLFLRLRGWLGGKGGLAGFLVAVVGLFVLMTPTVLIVQSIIESVGPLASKLAAGELHVPPPGEGVKDWPLVGGKVHDLWTGAHENFREFAEHYSEQIRGIATSILSTGSGLLGGVLQFALSIVFAAIFMSFADPLVAMSDRLAGRLASARGSQMLMMAAKTARNVTHGVIGVAVVQGGLGAIGVIAVGMPFAGVVAALLVASTIIQVPPLVFIPCIIYVWSAEPTMTAVIFTAYMIPVLFSDNVLKPILMARGLETPMIVILIGVIGGTVSGGLIGLFTGPVILAVFHKMIVTWLEHIADEAEDAGAAAKPAAEGSPEGTA